MPKLLRLDHAVLTQTIRRSCEIKSVLVTQDERETGERALLNFGHTVGHALEAATNYRLLRHGEAVLFGMLAEAYLSRAADLLSDEAFISIEKFLQKIPLKTRLAGIDLALVENCMALDKKAQHGQVRMVLLRGIGEAVITETWPRESLPAAIKYALQLFAKR